MKSSIEDVEVTSESKNRMTVNLIKGLAQSTQSDPGLKAPHCTNHREYLTYEWDYLIKEVA